MVVADSVTAILYSIAKYSGEKHSLMESEVIHFVKPCAAIEKWVVAGDFSIRRGFDATAAQNARGCSFYVLQKEAIQHTKKL